MRTFLIALALVAVSVFAVSPTASAVTVVNCDAAGISKSDCAATKTNDLDYKSGASRIWQLIQLTLGILGGISVIMIVIGGIRYATSNGDSSSVQSAKNTILYSVIGLVVAMSASAIVLLVQGFFLK